MVNKIGKLKVIETIEEGPLIQLLNERKQVIRVSSVKNFEKSYREYLREAQGGKSEITDIKYLKHVEKVFGYGDFGRYLRITYRNSFPEPEEPLEEIIDYIDWYWYRSFDTFKAYCDKTKKGPISNYEIARELYEKSIEKGPEEGQGTLGPDGLIRNEDESVWGVWEG